MKKKKFPKLLLCLALILAILVTGVTTPGFLLPLFGKLPFREKQEAKATAVPQMEEFPEPVYPGPDRDGKGHSAPFTLDPEPGFTVTAPENAFYEDTVMTVEPLSASDFLRYEDCLDAATEHACALYKAWRVDAGLAPDEFMPGQFDVTMDLAQLGIPEDLWAQTAPIHISEDGHITFYASELEGSRLRFSSRKNFSLGLAIFAIGASIYVTVNSDYGKFQGVWLGGMDSIKVFENQVGDEPTATLNPGATTKGKHICNLRVDKADIANWPTDRENALDEAIKNEAARMALETVTELYSRSMIEDLPSDPSKRQEVIDADQAMWTALYMKDAALKYKDELVALAEEKRKMAEEAGYTPQMLEDIGRYAQKAYKYLSDLGISLPSDDFDIFLKKNMEQPAYTTTAFYGGYAFMVVRYRDYMKGEAGKKQIELTIVHEMVHVAQAEYKLWSLKNDKFNEATAQLIEMDYSEKNGFYDIKHENAYAYNFFGVPMDDVYYTYEYGLEWADVNEAGYIWWMFLKYLMDRNPTVTYANILEAYREHYGIPSFSSLVVTAFHLGDTDKLKNAFFDFCVYKQDIFKLASTFNYARDPDQPQRTFPRTLADKTEGHQNRAYLFTGNDISMRLRQLVPSVGNDTAKQYGMILAASENLDKSGIQAIPVGNKNCTLCRHGVFYNPVPATTLKDSYMLEIDIQRSHSVGYGAYVDNNEDRSTGSRLRLTSDTYYDVYTLVPPEELKGEADGQYLKFRLPVRSLAAKQGLITGYRITVMANEGMDAPKELIYPITDSNKTKRVKLTEFINGDLIDRVLLKEEDDRRIYFTLSICEYVEDEDGTRHFGPESNQSGMDELLSKMGALTGKITISIYWPTKDDLDLHCVTPDGSHIYYSNPSAGGGRLDVDMQVQGESDAGAENIYFDNPISGKYEVYVNNYTDRTEGFDSSCRIRIKVGQRVIVDTTENVGSRSRSFTFDYTAETPPPDGGDS